MCDLHWLTCISLVIFGNKISYLFAFQFFSFSYELYQKACFLQILPEPFPVFELSIGRGDLQVIARFLYLQRHEPIVETAATNHKVMPQSGDLDSATNQFNY